MTCIIGLVHNGKAYIGADSQYLEGWHKVTNLNPKIFRKGELLIGSSGSQRVSDIVEHNLELVRNRDWVPIKYIADYFVPALRSCLSLHGAIIKKDTEEMGAVIMIGYKGKLFIIGEDFTISEVGPYEAIGAGGKYVYGYLYATGITDPIAAIHGALECAEHFCAGVCRPFVVEVN